MARADVVRLVDLSQRTRVWRDGRLEEEDFPAAKISEYLDQPDTMVWLDLCAPDTDGLRVISDELGLDPLAIEDAVSRHERPKLDRYETHLFLNAYAVRLDPKSGELETHEISAFITERALVTVRADHDFDIDAVVRRWDGSTDLARYGVAYLLHGLLDLIVDQHFEAVQSLDDEIDGIEERLFADEMPNGDTQYRSYRLRKSLALLRRVVVPMREVVNALLRRDLHVVPQQMMPYYQDVYDHTLRAAEWTESLRDLVTTILETNLTIQGNRMNVISKKVTGWAAIIAVPTFITGFYGMNVPYPDFGNHVGFIAAAVIMVVSGVLLYWLFRRNDWL